LWQKGWRCVHPSDVSRTSDKLYIYTWSQYTDEELLNNFTTQTGIQVVADVYDSNETMLAKLQAGGGIQWCHLSE